MKLSDAVGVDPHNDLSACSSLHHSATFELQIHSQATAVHANGPQWKCFRRAFVTCDSHAGLERRSTACKGRYLNRFGITASTRFQHIVTDEEICAVDSCGDMDPNQLFTVAP